MSDYTFLRTCDSCGGQPILKELGLCAVCCLVRLIRFGSGFTNAGKARTAAAQRYLKDIQRDLQKSGMDFAPDINRRVRHLLSLRAEVKSEPLYQDVAMVRSAGAAVGLVILKLMAPRYHRKTGYYGTAVQ